MRIALISDTHVGISRLPAVNKMFREMAEQKPDLVVYAGDYSGNARGAGAVSLTIRGLRSAMPTTPIVSVLGNHDFWCRTGSRQPGGYDYRRNYKKICDLFTTHNVHFLDENGPYTHPSFPDVKIIGCSGWYALPNPPTNDRNYLPEGLEGDTNSALLKRSLTALDQQLEQVRADWTGAETLVFVSHFPVVRGDDYKGNWDRFSWSESISNHLIDEFNCQYFLCGHSHARSEGPLMYNCGSDYYDPRYLIIEVT